MPLLDHRGQPIKASNYKKADPPVTGEKFGKWAGYGVELLQLPGGGIVQFDLSKLTLEDYRAMLTHYQVNSSLSVLSFMQHQSTWTIECSDPKIAAHCEENLSEIWTQLNRAMSQANWAGYSPNVLQWENDNNSNKVVLTKVKDLVPEFCVVNWKEVDGYVPPGDPARIPPKLRVYDGIKQFGFPYPIPVPNSFWYPILMENGDYYGKKLLKSAYTSYFFSMLMHLFSNRYYERFGEPVPVGRAPFEEIISVPNSDGSFTQMRSNEYMLQQMMSLRNRSAVVLPSDRDMDQNGRGFFDYDLEYLESQMRGADFERYMSRLDQEISLAIFTPILLMNVADVGSYNLGAGHMQMYLWMLNALNGDRKMYIDKYILSPMVDNNFGVKAPRAKIKFQKLDNTNTELLGSILQALIQGGQISFDTTELGQLVGLTISQINTLTGADGTDTGTGTGATDPQQKPTGKEVADPLPSASDASKNSAQRPTEVATEILKRVTGQVENAYRDGKYGPEFRLSMGYKRRMEQALAIAGVNDADTVTERMYSRLDSWAGDMAELGTDYLATPDAFVADFTKILDYEIAKLKS